MDQVKIGQFIKENRTKQNLSQRALAEKLCVKERTVKKWENGKAIPDSTVISELCNILQISVIDLLNGEIISLDELNKQNEKIILELTENVQSKQKTIISFTWTLLIISTVFFIFVALITHLAVKDKQHSDLIMLIATIIFVISTSLDFMLDLNAGHQVCLHCNHKFKPSFFKAILAPKKVTSNELERKMKCPKCGKKSWTKRVL